MPVRDGIELIKEVRELDAHTGRRTPAAALTAMARAEDRRLALDAGYQMHVAKPVDPFELAAAVERLAAHR
jgi:CheY-like chemotaxis protein